MRISRTEAFARAYRKLTARDPDLQARVDRAIRRLAEDPGHPGLHIHPVRSWPGCWEARVNDAVRIIFTRDGDEIILLMIGKHDVLP